jgi:hypothetical protein
MSAMNQEILIPLFALATWVSALYSENKFRYFYEGKNAEALARRTAGLRHFLIRRNRFLKWVGLGLLWAGFSLGSVLANGTGNMISTAAYAVGMIGLLTYVASRLWPLLAR